MKKLRLFDSLKLVLATVACMFAIAPAHAAILPAGYTELEYLESTGEQYVELSFGFDPTDMILADLSVNIEEHLDKYMVAPKVWNSNANRFAMGVHNYVYNVAYGNVQTGSTRLNPSKQNDGQIHKWIYGGYVFSIPELNTSLDVSDITFGTTSSNIRLFYGYNGGTKGKISYYKHVKANGTSVELIPARRDSDGVLGMYDLADANPSTAFHTNAGTGEFVAGPAAPIKIATTRYNEQQFAPVETRLDAAVAAVDTVVSQTMTQAQQIDQIATNKQTRPDEGCPAKYCLLVEDEDGTPHWYPIAGANGVAHNLPAGYTELQYTYMTSGSYLLTDIVPTYDGRIEMNFQTTSVPSGSVYLLGGRTVTYGGLFFAQGSSGVCLVDAFGTSSDDRYTSSVSLSNNTRYKFTFNNKVATLESGGTTLFTNTFTGILANGAALAINGLNSNGTVSGAQTGIYLYSLKVWNAQGELVANYIPAKQTNPLTVGFYDTVSETFKTATAGTFTAGPDM